MFVNMSRRLTTNLLRGAIVVLPLVLAVGVVLVASNSQWIGTIFYARSDAGVMIILVGVVISVLIAGGIALHGWLFGRYRRQLAQAEVQAQSVAQTELAADRRRFLQRLDHELKNPLTAIRAGVANLSDAPDAARFDAVSSISTQAARLSQLVTDLRKLAELETRPIETAAVDVSDLLQEVMSAARENADSVERRLGLTVPRVPWPLGSVQGDRDLLFLAIYNLLDNAIKFTRPGDTIELRAFEDGANVAIEVADTGPGIADEDLPHIWEELYRGKPTRALPGSGLGLALVRSIVARHNGTVTVRSRLGHGTVFTVRIPVDGRRPTTE